MNIELLSVIVPVYKKQKTIQKELESLMQVLDKTSYKYEIVAVVDGTSLDNSYEEAKKVNSSKVRVYGYKNNYGKGQAVRYGMQKAKGDIITFIDSGGDINPQGIVMLLEHMKWYNADIIIGSKLHSASKINYPFNRKVLTYGYYLFVKLLFGLRIRDTQTGLKAYKRKVLEKVLPLLVVKRFSFDIEILAVANYLGFNKIYDAPVEVDMDFGQSSIVGIFTSNGIWGFVHDTLAVWYRMHILNYYENSKNIVKVYDEDLDMYINTGDMKNKGQSIIVLVNNLSAKINYFRNVKK